ncbi:MAG: malto-oligosyltrehalose synthase [Nitrospirae bacterium GWC2_57_9]|nr:MAG: malto-oligosyltrehalose synthase [Nitrospirae bacterium GWC2_57_9]
MTNVPAAKIPGAAYRLQFNHNFTFRDAVRIIPYLQELGITDIYSSPFSKAQKGSLHGYDIVDHNTLNPEIGTEQDYAALTGELKRFGMGQLLDIVPNHMSIESAENRWWSDVLENGRTSPHAGYFDIDWQPVKKELLNKVLIPILGDQYGRVLEDQELRLVFEEGAFAVCYFEHKFPILPKSYNFILRHRVQELEDRLTADHPAMAELLSIMTALKHLPSYLDTDTATIEERIREKEVIKRRINTLYHDSPEIRAHVEDTLRVFNGMRGDPSSFELLDELMNQQIYRLSHWRVATEEINYRRFFDVNGLAAIRMENPDVFEAAHAMVFRLIREGSVTGLRADHPDGLYDPLEYFHRLQRGCFVQQIMASRHGEEDDPPGAQQVISTAEQMAARYNDAIAREPAYKPFYIVGEKILTKSERMPADWPIFSTTGYVFLNSVNGVFVQSENAKAFDVIYEKFIRTRMNFPEVIYDKKKLVMQVAMASEVNTLGRYLNDLSEKNRHTRDFTLNSLRSVIVEVVAAFPVYRTYINTCHVSDRDEQYIEQAVSRAKRRNPAINESIFDFLKDVLLLRFSPYCTEQEQNDWLDFVMRFQQFTGPVMAKGVEDTALSVYNRLVSLNEVGGMPDRFGIPLETFHGQNMERIKNWPHALITTSTHDTKRSEDVRARINVLSEMPREWGTYVRNWALLNRKHKKVIEGEKMPDRNDEYLLYQTLAGVWPLTIPDRQAYDGFVQRIKDYMLKEAREAKVNTSWINANKTYEDALRDFIHAVLDSRSGNLFLNEFLPFQKIISHFGMFNSLSQTLLKITAPGVPDVYQGADLWDYSLVDPDNRRPVDYDIRIRMLDELKKLMAQMPAPELCRDITNAKADGRIKLYLLFKALNFRKETSAVFTEGDYIALDADGARSENVCSFERRTEQESVVVAVPRFLSTIMTGSNSLPFGSSVWEDAVLVLDAEAGTEYRNVFTDELLTVAFQAKGKNGIPLAELFSHFPAALLKRMD